MAVVIETTLGDLTVDLYIEERPRACLNFLKLCKLKYYNYNLFHNVEHDFIAQTGDPTGDGDSGESVWGVVEGSHKRYFEAESLPKIKHTIPGLVSLVSVGKNLVGSQFFFTLGSDLTSLDGIHCVIGEVAEGHDTLRKLNEAIVDEKFRPYQDIRITHTIILEDPFDDPRGFQIPSRSPSPTPERLKNGRIGADEDINDAEGKTEEEMQEILQEREAKARATILEIVGDLPDADIAPPENVLFVCKLNPVTTDDDLEIIFSRFGKVKSCEVIRDKYTGDSLQYAFVEFEDKKACENAYFKMDNVLIDDRRIHVDFSQSVAKVKWRGKGRGVIHQDSNTKLDFDNLRNKDKNDNSKSRNRRRSRSREHDRYRKPNSERGREYYDRDRSRRYPENDQSHSRNARRDRSPENGHHHQRSVRKNESSSNSEHYRKDKNSDNSQYHRKESRKHDTSENRRNSRTERNQEHRSRKEESYDSKVNKESRKLTSRSKERKNFYAENIKSTQKHERRSSNSSSSSSESKARKKTHKKKDMKRKRYSSTSSSD